jgi:CRISPR/Cas system Type II protein with McrA/HNH and RuvC-like nuclease domain
LKVENQNKTNQTPFEYLAKGEKNSSEWQEYKNYIGSFIKQAKRNKLLNTTLPERRGNDLTDDDIENPYWTRRRLSILYITLYNNLFIIQLK